MPGKMTVLDRLIKEGRIKQSPFGVKKTSAELRDPLNYPLDMRKDFDRMKNAANTQWVKMTPEREVYQEGLESLRRQRMKPIRKEETDARERLKELQSDFEDAYSDAYESWQDEINSEIPDKAPTLEYGFAPEDLNFRTPEADLRDYWPPYSKYYDVFEREADDLRDEITEIEDRMDYARSPEYIQQLQTETPRYRNYQRAMQQRAANMAMGRDLSRRYAIAYNSLLRRGLTPAEARMYMREYFGGR